MQYKTPVYFDMSDEAIAEAVRICPGLAQVFNTTLLAVTSYRIKRLPGGLQLERHVGYIDQETSTADTFRYSRQESFVHAIDQGVLNLLLKTTKQFGRGIQQPVDFSL